MSVIGIQVHGTTCANTADSINIEENHFVLFPNTVKQILGKEPTRFIIADMILDNKYVIVHQRELPS